MIPSQHVCLHNKFRVNGRVHILSITAFNRKSCVVKLQKLLTLTSWVICFLLAALIIFSNIPNSLNPDQACCFVGSDLGII